MPDAIRPDGVDARLVPPGVADTRSKAFTATLGHALDEVPQERFDLTDFSKVDVRLLPALVRGLSLQEFMFDGITEGVIRRFLANAVGLHAKKGTTAGVRFGLSLVGMRVRWTPWFNQAPRGEPNTYKAIVYVNDQVFEDEPFLLSERNQRAALAVIDAMKRWSQNGTFVLGVGFTQKFGAADRLAGLAVDRRTIAVSPDLTRRNTLGAADRAAGLSVHQRPFDASPDLSRRSRLAAANRTATMQVLQIQGEARR